MEVILLENILNLGNIGDKVNVKNGYGRNFLLKKGKALRFNKENLNYVNKKYKKIPKKVGSGDREVTPLATVATFVKVISLVLTIDETISGIKS